MTDDLFFKKGPTKTLSPEDSTNIDTPESLGRALLTAVTLHYHYGLKILSEEHRFEIELSDPEACANFTSAEAVKELHRIAGEIPENLPPASAMNKTSERARQAAEVLYLIRLTSDGIKRAEPIEPEKAIFIAEGFFRLGAKVAEAHVSPWEPFAAIQHGAQTALINCNRNTPPHSPNALRAEERTHTHDKWKRTAENIWHKNPRLSASAVAIRAQRELGATESPNTIRKIISQVKPN